MQLITDFPLLWDGSMVKELGCGYKTWLAFFHHYKTRSESVHLVAGGAFAKGIEVALRCFYDGGESKEAAVEAGVAALTTTYGAFDPGSETKSLERMQGALQYYFTIWPLGEDRAIPLKPDGVNSEVEWTFCLELPIRHPVSGEPLQYAGAFDGCVSYAGAEYWRDEKTTGSLGNRWLAQWELNSSFTGYSWARREIGRPVAGGLVRGISILKTKYDHAQVIESRSDWEIDRWLFETCRKLEGAIKWWVECNSHGVTPPMALNDKCNDYGGCHFKRVCRVANPDPWLATHYEKRVWNPLSRMEAE